MNDLAQLFDNISQQTLMMLESLFVARIPPYDYIALQNQQKSYIYRIDPFVQQRSSAFTRRSLVASGARARYEFYRKPASFRSNSAPNQRIQAVKKDHFLTYYEFGKTMKICFSASLIQINSIFIQLLKGQPLAQKREYYLMLQGYEVDFKVADAIFGGCVINYLDLLNFITTQTTIVQQQYDVKIEPIKTPQYFAHRLVIEVAEYFDELGAFMTCSRDGLAQFWSSTNTSQQLNFDETEDMKFGMESEHIDGLVKAWTAEEEIRGLPRIKNIQVLSQVLQGQINIGKAEAPAPRPAVDISVPFNLIYTLTDPTLDVAAFPLKDQTTDYPHYLVVACRTADAPLPSGRPMPDRVWRNRHYKGGVYTFHEPENKSYRGGGYTLYAQCKGIPRSQSCHVRKFRDVSSKMEIGEFMSTAFYQDGQMQFSSFTSRNQLNSETDAFGAYQHPIYDKKQQTAIGKMARPQELQDQDPDSFEQSMQRHRKLNLEFKYNGKGSAWITAACYYAVARSFYFAVSGGYVSVYKLQKNGIELERKIKISGVAITKMVIWTRQLTRLYINRICDVHGIDMSKDSILAYLPGLYNDEIPQTGDVLKQISYCVYMSRDMLGFINLRTNKVVLELHTRDIAEDINNDFFSEICVFRNNIIIGMTSGLVLALDPADFSISSRSQPYTNEVSAFTFIESSSMLVTGNITGNIKIFDYATQPKQTQYLHDSGAILQLFASEKYDIIISVCVNGVITIFSVQQFTQLSKTFLNQNLTVAMWDDISGVLVVGEVELQAFQVIGSKKQPERKTIPQAHYCRIVSIVNLADLSGHSDGAPIAALTDSQLNQFLGQDNTQESWNENGAASEVQIPRFVYPAFKRVELPHRPRFMDEMKPCQPLYRQDPDKTPFSQYATGDEAYIVYYYSEDMNSSAQPRIRLLDAISGRAYQMLDFGAYAEKLGQTLRNKRGFACKAQTTGLEIMQLCSANGAGTDIDAGDGQNSLKGFITVDYDANLRLFTQGGQIYATYQLDLLDNYKVLSACYSALQNELYLSLSDGRCATFRINTSEIGDVYNVSNCAKAAYLLYFNGYPLENGNETEEFKQFLKTYKPSRYEQPEISVVYQDYIAVAVGELVLLYSKNSRRLSQRFVENMLLSGAKYARYLISGMTIPPSMILRGHGFNIVAMSACGKKLITADESGVVCFWFGFGIAKAVLKMTQDYIQRVRASRNARKWGWILFKDGYVWEVAIDKRCSYVIQFYTSGLKTSNIVADETKDSTLFAFTEENKGVVVRNRGNGWKITCNFMLPCACKITAMDLTMEQIIVTCSMGHIYMAKIPEGEVAESYDDLYPLYIMGENSTITRNPYFDLSFDKDGLLSMKPLIVSILYQNDTDNTISIDTRRLFEYLDATQRYIEYNLVLDEQCDPRVLGSKTDCSIVKMSNYLINTETVEVARKEALFGMKLNFK